jgi:hypothetical protein
MSTWEQLFVTVGAMAFGWFAAWVWYTKIQPARKGKK